MRLNGVEPGGQCFGIPARKQTLSILSAAGERCATSENAAPPSTVQDQRSETVFHHCSGRCLLKLPQAFDGRLKAADSIPQSCPAFQCGSPKCCDIAVQFHHHACRHETFHHRGEGYDRAAGERFNNDVRRSLPQPFPNVGNQPCLATRITQRASLRHCRDIYHRHARSGEGLCNCSHECSPNVDPVPVTRPRARIRLTYSFSRRRYGIVLSFAPDRMQAGQQRRQRTPSGQLRSMCHAAAVRSSGNDRVIRKIGTALRPNVPRALPAASAPIVTRSCRACLTLPKSTDAINLASASIWQLFSGARVSSGWLCRTPRARSRASPPKASGAETPRP